MNRSFRWLLAIRFTAAMAFATGAIATASLLGLRSFLDRQLNASILNVASIQAASVTDSPSGAMHFHEWQVTPDEARAVQGLIRYAQVWDEEGRSLLRSQFMTADLPRDPGALASMDAGDVVWREQSLQGVPIRSLFYPLARHGPAHAGHVLQVAAPLVERNQMVDRLAAFSVAITLLVTIASFTGSWWLAGRAMRPVREITDQAEAIGAGSLERRINAYADTGEYRRLVDVLNTMLDRIQRGFEVQRRFTADASHELRSPLTALRAEIEVALRRDRSTVEYRGVLASNLEEIARLSRITEDLLTIARADAGALRTDAELSDLSVVARGVVDRLRPRAAETDISLLLTGAPKVLVPIDPDLLGRVIWNLCDNALRYAPAGTTVELCISERAASVDLIVTDRGPGLGGDPERLFDRFVRDDPVRTPGDAGGAGLGLPIARAIAEAYGGSIRGDSKPDGGARLVVTLPRSS